MIGIVTIYLTAAIVIWIASETIYRISDNDTYREIADQLRVIVPIVVVVAVWLLVIAYRVVMGVRQFV